MDVVYVVREGDDNEQLRYSLRSLANLKHDQVWIAGYKPSWVTGVRHIKTTQAQSRYKNSTGNLRAACEHPDVSQRFSLFNDDFYVMEPIRQIPRLHRGPVVGLMGPSRPNHKLRQNGYLSGMWDTFDLLERMGHDAPLSYELHVPMSVDKSKMLATLDAGAHVDALHKRTLYGNMHRHGGRQVEDAKVHNRKLPATAKTFLSTSPSSFLGQTGDLLRERFPTPSEYEVA